MFNKNQKQLLFTFALFFSIFMLGCTVNENTDNYSQNSKASDLEQQKFDNSTKLEIQKIQGKLIYEKIPPGKSVRAYTGEEFFLKKNTINQTKIVLLPSEKITHSQLKSFQNQDVEIIARYKQGIRSDSSKNSCPLDSDGQCMIQGQGYEVLSIVTN